MDVPAQFRVIHLRRLPNLLLEISRRFAQLRKRGDLKLAVVFNSSTVQLAIPALLIDPALQLIRPMRAFGEDAAGDFKTVRVKLENRDASELVPVGIEELVVVDIGMLTENPLLVGTQVCLRRLALDLIA